MNYQELFEVLIRATPAITIVFLFTLIIMLTLRWLKKPHPQSNQEQNPASNLYDRIHNYQNSQPAKTSRTYSRSHSQSNTSTDSNYHHAIKLLQRGTDIKTLVEYCNLTQGEAELLHAVYAKKA
ncbi:MAG: DUF2802 domain-containing protein [Gammaproteobacteria bacterium]|nr:DUF2802 domain-containing protein [Gammaproteobacteria bacterium]